MLAAVAFVPTTDVIRAFESLSENLPPDAPAQAIIDYFEDTYIGRFRPGGQRRDPLFPITVWNMYKQTLQGLPRTNNAVEGWHRSFQARTSASPIPGQQSENPHCRTRLQQPGHH